MEKHAPELADHINIRMTVDEVAALRQLATMLDITLSELLRLLIARGLTDFTSVEE